MKHCERLLHSRNGEVWRLFLTCSKFQEGSFNVAEQPWSANSEISRVQPLHSKLFLYHVHPDNCILTGPQASSRLQPNHLVRHIIVISDSTAHDKSRRERCIYCLFAWKSNLLKHHFFPWCWNITSWSFNKIWTSEHGNHRCIVDVLQASQFSDSKDRFQVRLSTRLFHSHSVIEQLWNFITWFILLYF